MSKIAAELMVDIEKDVVDMKKNFDNTRDEPTVLPSRFPNLLVNGAVGIAVGMATNIPPHNMGEVIDGAIHLMDHPDATVPDLMQFVKGPDFPTGATVYGTAGIFEAYMTGHSRVTVRAKAEIEEEKRRIIITEIPYQVNKSALIESMADQVREKKIEGVTEIRDESGRATGGKELRGPDGMRIVIEYRRDQSGQVILNQFYKYTQLQDTCPINMLALVRGEPKVLNLKQILSEYVKFQEEVVTRRIRFDLAKAKREAHIYEGYKIAVDNIEEVIRIIRASADVSDAKINLQNRFGLDEEQSAAIVAMTLGRLSGLERQKIEEHLAELYKTIEELEAILADESKLRDIIRDELTEIKNRFSDDRRTELVEAADDIVYEDLIDREDCVVTLTRAGYIKRLPADTYSAQNRGGKGVIGMTTKEDDFIERIQVVHSHATLLFFTSHGRVFVKKAYMIPEAGRTAKGTNIVNLLDIEQGESVTAMITVDGFSEEEALVMVTRRGIIKRTPLSEYEAHRKGGKIALTLDEGDELIFVAPTDGTKDIFIATRNAQAVRFAENKVRLMGRTAGGVIGVKLIDDDEVIGAAILERDEAWNEKFSLLTITEKGFGKRMECSLFEPKGRAIQGVTCHHLSDKTGPLCGVAIVTEEDDLMMITESGSVIRTPASGIPAYGRTAGGVIVMRLAENDRICNVTVAQQKEEDETVEVEG